MKVSDAEIRLAEWTLKKCCTQNLAGCRTCPHASRCTAWGHEAIPEEWDIPEPPPEPTKRQRIEWARMLPDKELIMAMENSMGCSKCDDEDDPNCYQVCADGVLPWWHEVVTLERFRKDAGLNNDRDS